MKKKKKKQEKKNNFCTSSYPESCCLFSAVAFQPEFIAAGGACQDVMVGCQILQLILLYDCYNAQQDKKKKTSSNCCYLCESRTIMSK